MNSYLVQKYSQSTHYHYKKAINELLENKRCSLAILIKDFQLFYTPKENLTRYYNTNQLKDKLQMLGEYYKFHNDIPRLFMIPAILTLNYYHDRKRRIAYFRIARLIAQENQNNPGKPAKGIVGDSPIPLSSHQVTAQDPSSSDEALSKHDKILQGISFLVQEPDSIEQIKKQIQSMVKLRKQPLSSSIKIASIGSNTTTSKSNKQSIIKPSSKSPPSIQAKKNLKLGEGLSPRMLKPQLVQSTKNSKKSIMIPPAQQFMKLSASMKQSILKQNCVSARSINQRKNSVTNILNILKSPHKNRSDQVINQTPRDLLESKRSFNTKKVHQLELQVMSDLQNLLQKKCLTHRSTVTNKNLKKKLNTRELNQFIRLPLSNREVNSQQKQ